MNELNPNIGILERIIERAQELIDKAKAEGRDVNREDVEKIRQGTDDRMDDLIG